MDIFYHCINTVLKECQKTGFTINKDLCKIENNIDVNFELPINRITFMYKFGTYSVYFFKKCFLEFVANYQEISFVLDKISSSKLVCSLSNGPGTDIIGLQLALKELGKSFNQKSFFKIISKYGSWRNTMNILIDKSTSAIPITGVFKLIQCNVMDSLSSKAENCLKSADIVIIDHAFASPNAQKVKILGALKIFLQILKPGTYVFFIDTKTKTSYFDLFNSYGNYIYGPKQVQVDDVPYDKKIAEHIGEQPVCSGKAYFGVWQKNKTENEGEIADNLSLVNVIPAMSNFKENSSSEMSGKSDRNASIENISTATPIKKQVENNSTPQINLSTGQNFRGSTSCKLSPMLHTPVNVIPDLQNSEESSFFVNDPKSQFHCSYKKHDEPVILIKPSQSNADNGRNVSCSLTNSISNSTTSEDSIPLANGNATKSENENPIIFENLNNCSEDMKTLLHSLNSLVTKLETFLSSEMTSKNLSPLKCDGHIPVCYCLCLNHHYCCPHKRCCCEHNLG